MSDDASGADTSWAPKQAEGSMQAIHLLSIPRTPVVIQAYPWSQVPSHFEARVRLFGMADYSSKGQLYWRSNVYCFLALAEIPDWDKISH